MLLIKKDAILRLFLCPWMGGQIVAPCTICTSTIPGGRILQRARTAMRLCPKISTVIQRTMKAAQLCLLLLLTGSPSFAKALSSSCSSSLATAQYDENAVVDYIHDGDTLRLRDGRRVRLIGINTPELARDNKPADAYSSKAREALRSLFKKDNSIGLIFGKDKKDHYGRFLAHVFSADKQNAQAALLKYGYAFAISIPPNTQLATCYLALENEARCNNRGLWQDTTIISANELNHSHAGFHLIQGNVENIKIDKKGIWLNLDN